MELVDALKRARLLHVADNVPVSADKPFLTGGWLERYVFTLLRAQGLHVTNDLGLSAKVAEGDHADSGTTSASTERNELDVALLAGNRLHALECNTVTKPDLYMDFLYKIAFQGRLGGLTTRLGLVALAPLGDSVKERARNARIEVFDLDDWMNLPTRLAAWIGTTPAQAAPDADRAALALSDAVARMAERFVRRPPPKSPGSATYPQGSSQNISGTRANAGGKVGAAR